MYLIREVLHCKPGKVRPMVEKFTVLSGALADMGLDGFRLLTDVTGEQFWTLVAETEVERIEDFFAVEQELMANGTVREAMDGYHDLVETGHREIYRIEGGS
ncbi:MAG: hypothetical protein GWM90_30585 [Gemmatimonadetes bacterium]|nr:hypothetical protein [Gemmatimonadota bacterium]NIQ59543.1 hypothetical protein [Gemmatimonadota bacterium]NIU79731.1 hypothetical protein [Gammaproteobacteria bacterium]NIX48252.1 hypothetical protein [Gemmatimonadota bacterium]NIY12693.1 hypothetical protein [Gemmatimonadota bacterium]